MTADKKSSQASNEKANLVRIPGTKIILRDWIEEDLPVFRSWHLGHHRWKELDGPYYQTSDAETEQWLSLLEKKIKDRDFSQPRNRLVIADLQTNAYIGNVNSYWISKETNWLAAGISIKDPKFWGAGIGKEALALWIDYLFESHPEIVRLDMQTWSGNQGMIGLAKKLGFQLEGCFRKARIVKGEYFDSLQFGILREEWMDRKKF